MSSSSDEEDRRQDVFARLQELRATESDAKRKRREDLLGRAQLRVDQRARVSLVSAVHLDLSEVHSKVSGPKLTWDFDNASVDLEIDADRFGGSGSRTALEHHIKQRLSQANAKLLARQIQQAPPISRSNSHSLTSTEKMSEQAAESSVASSDEEDVDIYDSMPELIPLVQEPDPEPILASEDEGDFLLPPPPPPPQRSFAGFSQNLAPTQRVAPDASSPRSDATEPAGAPSSDDDQPDIQRRVLSGPLMSDSNMFIPGRLRSHRVSEEPDALEADDVTEAAASDASEDAAARAVAKEAAAAAKLERRLARKKRQKEIRKELRGFLEEAAEESDDEEFATFRGRRGADASSGSDESSEEEDEGDLEDLVADAEEEARMARRAQKDTRKLAKLHEEWAEAKDKELEERAEKGEFRKRRKMDALLGDDEGGMSRRERMRRAKYDSNGERILSSDEESDEDYEDEWLSEEDDEKEKRDKAKRKKEAVKKINEEKILRQKNLNSVGLVSMADKGEYENSVKEVSVFGVEKLTNQTPVFSFLAGGTKKVGFR